MVRQDLDCELFRGNLVERPTASLLVLDLSQIGHFIYDSHSVATTLGDLQTDFQFVSPFHAGLSVSYPYVPQSQDPRSTKGGNIVEGDMGGDMGGDVGAPQ